MIPERETFFAELESRGEPEVRGLLAQRAFGNQKIALVDEWLRLKDAERDALLATRNESRAEQALEFARAANDIAASALSEAQTANTEAREANRLASKANDLALVASQAASAANERATEASRIVRKANRIAIAAIIISALIAILAIVFRS